MHRTPGIYPTPFPRDFPRGGIGKTRRGQHARERKSPRRSLFSRDAGATARRWNISLPGGDLYVFHDFFTLPPPRVVSIPLSTPAKPSADDTVHR